MRVRDILAIVLAFSLVVPGCLVAQEVSAPAGQAPQRAGGLNILVLQGQDAVNSIRQHAAASPAVQVFGSLGEPVQGAEVTFEVPPAGPGGMFENQKTSITKRTDARGQAVASFTPNTLAGRFTIRVVARTEDEKAEVSIRQINSTKSDTVEYSARPGRAWYKDWKWWTVIAAGAGAGAYLGYRSATSSSSPSSPTISVAPGGVVIGAP